MEDRKKVEIEYYDKRVNDFDPPAGGLGFLELSSYKFLYQLLRENCQNKIVLDYGSGSGIHAVEIAKMGARKVVGIDLSEKSLQVARERAKGQGLGDRVEFLKMDCEKMEFPDNSFDIIFDGGTFSSIDLRQAWPEILRVLKPDGVLIGIETFGHNPITNLKRKLNKLTGKRTAWAAEHIFRMEDLEKAKKYFRQLSVHYFHLISWAAFPFLKLPGGKLLLRTLEFFDKILLRRRFLRGVVKVRQPRPLKKGGEKSRSEPNFYYPLRKYAFKVVFIFSKQ